MEGDAPPPPFHRLPSSSIAFHRRLFGAALTSAPRPHPIRLGLPVWLALMLLACGGAPPQPPAPELPPFLIPEPGPEAPVPPDTGVVPMRLALNIPSYRLEVYRGESLIRAYRVAVGDSSFPTPIGQFAISRVEWDPWWNPPASEWAKGDTVIPPGPENPMGRVKLAFRDLYFIHGTARGQSLGQPASHGCVRLANPQAVELADLVQRYGSSQLRGEQVDSIAAQAGSGNTKRFDLQRPVLLQLRYEVVEVRPDTVLLYPDIYALEGTPLKTQVLGALARAGYDTTTLDSTRVNALELPRTGRRVIPIDILRRPATAPLGTPRR